jgi:hypothetical protein
LAYLVLGVCEHSPRIGLVLLILNDGLIQRIPYTGKDKVVPFFRAGDGQEFGVACVLAYDGIPIIVCTEFSGDRGLARVRDFYKEVAVLAANDHVLALFSNNAAVLSLSFLLLGQVA